jgi:hypothetical protein
MPFKQGKKEIAIIEKDERKEFRGDLFATGYKPHTGPRTQREGEIQAWVKPIGRGRQVHVQEELQGDGSIKVYAHTEPAGYGLDHLVAAVLDEASFSGGGKVLRGDLRKRGRKL